MIDLVRSTGVCSTCSRRKRLIDFYSNPKSPSGRTYACKACIKLHSEARRHERGRVDRSDQMPAFDLSKPISYRAAHLRTQNWRGRASIHQCGCGAQADQWAYRHDSEHERTDVVDRGPGPLVEVRYSPNPMDYDPMCQSCHTKFDRSRG